MKRSRYKIETPHSSALKKMRNARKLSLVKTARLLGVNESDVNHYENGRRYDVPKDYIEKFVMSLGFSMDDWNDFLKGQTSTFDLQEECKVFINRLDRDKLKAIHTMLLSFVGSK